MIDLDVNSLRGGCKIDQQCMWGGAGEVAEYLIGMPVVLRDIGTLNDSDGVSDTRHL
jgi:hypothetical protein